VTRSQATLLHYSFGVASTPAATENETPHVEVSMHPNLLHQGFGVSGAAAYVMSVNWFAHTPIRARKLATVFQFVQSNGFNSPSMVGINSLTVG